MSEDILKKLDRWLADWRMSDPISASPANLIGEAAVEIATLREQLKHLSHTSAAKSKNLPDRGISGTCDAPENASDLFTEIRELRERVELLLAIIRTRP